MSQDTNSPGVSRRQLLVTSGSAVAAGVAVTGTVSGQSRTTRRVVIPGAEDFVGEEEYPGYFLHFGEETPGDLDASELQGCEFDGWSPEGLAYHEGTLIDRKNDDTRQIPTTIYSNVADDIERGTLWVINRRIGCPSDYIGLETEQIGASQVPGTVAKTDTTAEAETTNGGGAGFGVLATLGSIAGLLALRRRSGT